MLWKMKKKKKILYTKQFAAKLVCMTILYTGILNIYKQHSHRISFYVDRWYNVENNFLTFT